jgi:hypothetical protein
MRLPAKLHYAWVVAAVTFVVLLLTAGVRAAPGILIVPLENEFHWARIWAECCGSRSALEAFLFAGLLCFAAVAMAVSIGAGGRRAEPARDPVPTA